MQEKACPPSKEDREPAGLGGPGREAAAGTPAVPRGPGREAAGPSGLDLWCPHWLLPAELGCLRSPSTPPRCLSYPSPRIPYRLPNDSRPSGPLSHTSGRVREGTGFLYLLPPLTQKHPPTQPRIQQMSPGRPKRCSRGCCSRPASHLPSRSRSISRRPVSPQIAFLSKPWGRKTRKLIPGRLPTEQ